jgi:hypothetical protein
LVAAVEAAAVPQQAQTKVLAVLVAAVAPMQNLLSRTLQALPLQLPSREALVALLVPRETTMALRGLPRPLGHLLLLLEGGAAKVRKLQLQTQL